MARTATRVTIVTLMIGLTFFVVDSLAAFTDQETNAANTFSTGTIVIGDTPDSAFLTVSANRVAEFVARIEFPAPAFQPFLDRPDHDIVPTVD